MIDPKYFYNALVSHGTDFFTGVPDSLLKNFCAYITDNTPEDNHIIASNEGGATALASGYHFATGKIPLVYMQNSGIGNAVNPLLSLVDPEVYSIPMVLVIGWRGEPGFHDEPQHVKQGKTTCSLLDAMQIPYVIMADDTEKLDAQIAYCYKTISEHNAPFAFVVKKNTFGDYTLKNNVPTRANMKREEAIEHIMLNAPETAAFVSTTGMASRELYELREKHHQGHEKDFLTVGSMGHASQIALAIAMQKKNRPIFVIDGDGATIMQMGGLAIIGSRKPSNLIHIVLNNGAHDSVGGQPTVGLKIDVCAIAKACGYESVIAVGTADELEKAMKDAVAGHKLTLIQVKVQKGARKDLGRPKSTPQQNKQALMEFLSK
ncbi:MAG: phosphonopyruvate decarboxylase [Treponema sp.]|nr:phosphonopyruvate decarboxylase [Treponema sp.]